MTDTACRQAFEEWLRSKYPIGDMSTASRETRYDGFRAAYRISEADRVDAERYQWLRKQECLVIPGARIYFRDMSVEHLRWTILYVQPNDIDAAIDAARGGRG